MLIVDEYAWSCLMISLDIWWLSIDQYQLILIYMLTNIMRTFGKIWRICMRVHLKLYIFFFKWFFQIFFFFFCIITKRLKYLPNVFAYRQPIEPSNSIQLRQTYKKWLQAHPQSTNAKVEHKLHSGMRAVMFSFSLDELKWPHWQLMISLQVWIERMHEWGRMVWVLGRASIQYQLMTKSLIQNVDYPYAMLTHLVIIDLMVSLRVPCRSLGFRHHSLHYLGCSCSIDE